MEGVCAKCLPCKGFEGFEKWCPECESEQPQPFKDHPIKKGVRCCKKCASDATDGLWLCKGFGCREEVAEGKWRLISCWSKGNQKRRENHGNKPDTFCMDCNSPKCSNQKCTTCRKCRNPSCRLKHCNSEPKPLNAYTLKNVYKKGHSNYLCLRCEGLACAMCGIQKSKKQKERERKRGNEDKSTDKQWHCTDCQKKK